jgi:hypothetical protein
MADQIDPRPGDAVTDGLIVECYAGYRGDETPVRFRRDGASIEVEEILDRWLAPDHRYFKVRTADGVYILRHNVTSGAWEMTFFERRSSERSTRAT